MKIRKCITLLFFLVSLILMSQYVNASNNVKGTIAFKGDIPDIVTCDFKATLHDYENDTDTEIILKKNNMYLENIEVEEGDYFVSNFVAVCDDVNEYSVYWENKYSDEPIHIKNGEVVEVYFAIESMNVEVIEEVDMSEYEQMLFGGNITDGEQKNYDEQNAISGNLISTIENKDNNEEKNQNQIYLVLLGICFFLVMLVIIVKNYPRIWLKGIMRYWYRIDTGEK